MFVDQSTKGLYLQECEGRQYELFLDYALSSTDYFMLVYKNYYNHGFSKPLKEIRSKLAPLKIKRRSNPQWPGTPGTYCRDTAYQVVFYKNDSCAKDVLLKAEDIFGWRSPLFPEDLAFFRGNECWFYSVAHEKIAMVVEPNDEDITFFKRLGLYEDTNLTNHAIRYYEELQKNMD